MEATPCAAPVCRAFAAIDSALHAADEQGEQFRRIRCAAFRLPEGCLDYILFAYRPTQ